MTPTEVWVYLEAKRPKQTYSGMNEDEVEELMEMRKHGDFL